MTKQEWMEQFAKNLREKIKRSGFTREELAFRMNMSEPNISAYINKRRTPSVKSVINLAYALDCGIDELIDFGDIIE